MVPGMLAPVGPEKEDRSGASICPHLSSDPEQLCLVPPGHFLRLHGILWDTLPTLA
jgi:hypothetical protein